MQNLQRNTINIADIIAPIVSSRDIVDSLASMIEETNSTIVDLDFKNVEFISRSAAHEFLLLKERFQQQRNINLYFSNTDENVANMLRIVASNRAIPKVVPSTEVEIVSLENLFS